MKLKAARLREPCAAQCDAVRAGRCAARVRHAETAINTQSMARRREQAASRPRGAICASLHPAATPPRHNPCCTK